jgi:hypothetical protein
MTTKKKFEIESPEVVVLRNGRFAFKADCPWNGKGGKPLVAYKFCSAQDWKEYCGPSEKVVEEANEEESAIVPEDESDGEEEDT